MRALLVLLVSIGIVCADIGLGYNYKTPKTSYEPPAYSSAGNYGGYSSAYSGGLGSSYGNGGYKGLGLDNSYYQSSSSSGNVAQPYNYYNDNSGLSSGYSQYSSSSAYQSSAQESYQNSYQIQQQPPIVYKDFYIHAAPEEPELPKVRTPIVLPPAQKRYKIIFVKVPSEGYRSQAIIPVQQQNEEKTIVYVLVKKPEDHHELIVPKVDQKPPSKPEVFFIKYNNKEDSQAVIDNIVKDYNQGENVITSFNSGAAQGSGEGSYNSGSNYVNQEYGAPVQTDVSTSAQASGNGVSAFSSAGSGADYSEANVDSSVPPITVSSTASSVDYDGASSGGISTSQGVPYETYGPPKFRFN